MSEDRNVQASPEDAHVARSVGEQEPAAAVPAPPPSGTAYQVPAGRVGFGKVIRSSAVLLVGAGLIGGLVGGGVVAFADRDDRPSFSRTVGDGGRDGGRFDGQDGQGGQGRQLPR